MACLLACLLFACALAFKLFSITLFRRAGWRGSIGNQPSFVKNALSIAQNCSETQISFARAQPSRQKRGVDRLNLFLLSRNPLVKNVVSQLRLKALIAGLCGQCPYRTLRSYIVRIAKDTGRCGCTSKICSKAAIQL